MIFIIRFVLFVFVINLAFAGHVIENRFFMDAYLKNCSGSLGRTLNFCYPDEEENPNDYFKYATCEQELEIESFCSEDGICETVVSNEPLVCNANETKGELITRCEVEYQIYLSELLINDYPNVNISFKEGLTIPELIIGASYYNYNFQKDILLLPGHDFGDFCDEAYDLDKRKIKTQVELAKKVMDQVYYSDGFIQSEMQIVIDFLNDSTLLDIISVECGNNNNYKAHLVGKHYEEKEMEVPQTQSVQKDFVEDDNTCIDPRLESLLEYHESKISINPLDIEFNVNEVPYTAFSTISPRSIISRVCNEWGDNFEFTTNGVLFDGKILPPVSNESILDPNGLYPISRNFIADINETREDEGVDLLDGTWIAEAMSAMSLIEYIKNSKSDHEQEIPEGYYALYNICTKRYDIVPVGTMIIVKQNEDTVIGDVLTAGDCEISDPIVYEVDNSLLENSDYANDYEDYDDDEDYFEDEDTGY